MNTARRFVLSAWVLGLASRVQAAPALPYDEAADARADLNRALQQARSEHKQVLVVFGANWCPDCRDLALKMATGSLASHVGRHFIVTKVDVARFNKNTDLAQQMGNPIRMGIPAVAVLRADGSLVKATTGGELADARNMGESEILKLLQGMSSSAP
ncbi:thioredoxin family protein [Piscinibacter sp.]|jgi:thioredoxin-like negative regulator of GroEL|uniref:thioredoxin family protein n=1 Tax=Piscinibacter sp. TaxID=1903157 RepID=UPI002F3F4A82